MTPLPIDPTTATSLTLPKDVPSTKNPEQDKTDNHFKSATLFDPNRNKAVRSLSFRETDVRHAETPLLKRKLEEDLEPIFDYSLEELPQQEINGRLEQVNPNRNKTARSLSFTGTDVRHTEESLLKRKLEEDVKPTSEENEDLDYSLGELPEIKATSAQLGEDLESIPEENDAEVKSFECINESITNTGTVQRNKKEYPVEAIPGAYGDFVQLYTIKQEKNTSQIIEGVLNNTVVIKAFHETAVERNPSKALVKFMSNSVAQYHQLTQLNRGFHIAKLYNADTAKKDLFYVMEYIPHPVDISSWKDPQVRFENLKEENQKVLLEVRKFMELMESEKIVLDLKPSNFRLDDKSDLYLVDFAEEPDSSELIANLCQAILLWSQGNQYICNFLKFNMSDDYLKSLKTARIF